MQAGDCGVPREGAGMVEERVRDDFEAYVEVQADYGRLAGGNRDEVEAFWKRTENETGALRSRLVLRDGTVLAERPAGSKHLHERVKKFLATDCECGHPVDEHWHGECEEDGCNCQMADVDEQLETATNIIAELASLLGIDP